VPSSLELSTRRQQLLDSAVTVLAAHGWRGFTHRAVDREAGLPEGSCSAYYRSRGALQSALAEFVVWHLMGDVEALADDLAAHPGDHDHAVAAVGAAALGWVSEKRFLTARLELALAATRDDDLLAQLSGSRAALTELVHRILERDGRVSPADPCHSPADLAATAVAAVDGVLIAALALPDAARRDFVTGSLDILLSSLGPDGSGTGE